MTTASTRRLRLQSQKPALPQQQAHPIIHGNYETIRCWLFHYWQKLNIPEQELCLLAITQDRQEFMRWTGKRLNLMTLGCYCYVPASTQVSRRRSGGEAGSSGSGSGVPAHRHLIFIEPDMQPRSIEVTVAHELIHLADRVRGTPRRHRHHGHDAIALEEAAITGYSLEELRALLHEESAKRERLRRERRPVRYLYECPNCGKKYPRTRRYSQAVSCSSCDRRYNPRYRLLLSQISPDGEEKS
ncbi:MAG: hypothetical protein IMW89_08110 [Ktedonobacteraceae bacterium]|nr:hypothetical protein [Ktedonobacteraceae bacterium]